MSTGSVAYVNNCIFQERGGFLRLPCGRESRHHDDYRLADIMQDLIGLPQQLFSEPDAHGSVTLL